MFRRSPLTLFPSLLLIPAFLRPSVHPSVLRSPISDLRSPISDLHSPFSVLRPSLASPHPAVMSDVNKRLVDSPQTRIKPLSLLALGSWLLQGTWGELSVHDMRHAYFTSLIRKTHIRFFGITVREGRGRLPEASWLTSTVERHVIVHISIIKSRYLIVSLFSVWYKKTVPSFLKNRLPL